MLKAFFVIFVWQALQPVLANQSDIPDENWGYVKVRDNAFMFWWLYGAQVPQRERINKPLVLWLQGGPGGSGTGYGNFVEIGPLNVGLEPRNTTWLKEVNLLFVDNPVGCGFSYVNIQQAFTKNISGTVIDPFRQRSNRGIILNSVFYNNSAQEAISTFSAQSIFKNCPPGSFIFVSFSFQLMLSSGNR